MFPGLVLFRRLKDERLGRAELCARVPGIPFARGRVDHPDGSACREIQFVEIHPDTERIEHRFVVVDAVFLVGDRAPARRRDVRFVANGASFGAMVTDRYQLDTRAHTAPHEALVQSPFQPG